MHLPLEFLVESISTSGFLDMKAFASSTTNHFTDKLHLSHTINTNFLNEAIQLEMLTGIIGGIGIIPVTRFGIRIRVTRKPFCFQFSVVMASSILTTTMAQDYR